MDQLARGRDGALAVAVDTRVPGDPGAWTLSSRIVGPPGVSTLAVPGLAPEDGTLIPVATASGPCSLRAEPEGPPSGAGTPASTRSTGWVTGRTSPTSSSRFWPLQWFETGIYAALTLGLMGLCLWLVRRRQF
ncbi:hypothetical protein ACFQ0B_01385 [Nonomuraea thailandensis]